MDTKKLYEKFIQNPVITTDSRNIPVGSLFFALKGENFDGKTFANADNTILTNLLESYEYTGYGNGTENICVLKNLSAEPFLEIQVFFLKKEDMQEIFEEVQLKSNLIGAYNTENILAAACMGYYFNVPVKDIQDAVLNYQPSNNRSQYIITKHNEIIMDAYNANPTSMKASIENFASINKKNKVLILGDMLELGDYSKEEHLLIISIVNKAGFENCIFIGNEFYKIVSTKEVQIFENIEKFIIFTKLNPIKNSFILIKGSRGIRLEKSLDYL